MALVADLSFGVEDITVGDVTKAVDVCSLADDIFFATKQVPDGLNQLEDIKAQANAVNGVLKQYGFPEIPVPVQALKFSEDVLNAALSLKKKACGIHDSDDEPESPNDFLVSE